MGTAPGLAVPVRPDAPLLLSKQDDRRDRSW